MHCAAALVADTRLLLCLAAPLQDLVHQDAFVGKRAIGAYFAEVRTGELRETQLWQALCKLLPCTVGVRSSSGRGRQLYAISPTSAQHSCLTATAHGLPRFVGGAHGACGCALLCGGHHGWRPAPRRRALVRCALARPVSFHGCRHLAGPPCCRYGADPFPPGRDCLRVCASCCAVMAH